jgi:phospholipase C
MIVVSPFSAGGYVCSDKFDHTSQLRFLETLFDVTAPNVTNWRRSVTGDLTAALPVLGAPVTTKPKLPLTSDSTKAAPIGNECTSAQLLESNPKPSPFVIPKHQTIPKQAPGSLKRTPH